MSYLDMLPKLMTGYVPSEVDLFDDEMVEQTLHFWDDEDDDDPYWDDLDSDEDMQAAFIMEKNAQIDRAQEQGIDPWATAQVQPDENIVVSSTRWMKKYENGKIPTEALMSVEGLGMYRPDAGRALRAMKRAAKKDGIVLTGGGYRSYEAQVALKDEKPHLAAAPGTSNHGWGIATDLSGVDFGTAAYKWLAENAGRFGWQHPEWAQANGSKPEPWHWEYHGGYEGGHKTKAKPKAKRRPRRNNVAAYDITEQEEYDPFTTIPGVLTEMFRPRVPAERGKAPKATGKVPDYVPDEFKRYVLQAARKYRVPASLIAAVGKVENGWDPDGEGTSSAGARGPMQTMPFWSDSANDPLGKFNPNERPKRAIMLGALILAHYIKQADGDIRMGLASYNAGPGNVAAGLDYADKVMEIWRS